MLIKSIKKKIIWLLDRNGFRGLLCLLASTIASIQISQRVIIKYADGIWEHYYADGYRIADTKIRFTRSIAQHLPVLKETWYSIYMPSLGDTIFDIGAGVGDEMILFSQDVGDQGHVVCIEAHPQTFRCLQRTCELNGFFNVTLVNKAVMDVTGRNVSMTNDYNHENNLVREEASGDFNIVTITVDDLIQKFKIKEVNFLKMNIEGAETHALKGIVKSYPKILNICVSCHDFLWQKTNDISMKTYSYTTNTLQENDYNIVMRDHHKKPWVRYQVNGKRLTS